jgi:hypothetical protein
MANTIELRSLDNLSTFDNLTSPFYTGTVLQGFYNTNHTSTVGIAFDRTSLPTPWPILLGSLGLSLITASWALYTIRESARRNWFTGLWFTLLNTIRSVSALVATSRIIAGHGGHWSPPTSLCTLVLANIPYIYRSPAPFDSIAIINTLIAFAALGMAALLRITNRKGCLTAK